MAAKGSTSFVQGHCYHVHFDAKQFGRPDAKPVVAYGWVESADSERVIWRLRAPGRELQPRVWSPAQYQTDANIRALLAARAFCRRGRPRFVCRSRTFCARIIPAGGVQGPSEAITLVDEEVCEASLADVLTEGPLSVSQSLVILQELAAALVDCHRAGVAHMDIKPDNVGISGRWFETRLHGFGCAVFRRPKTHAAHPAVHLRVEKRGRDGGCDLESLNKRKRAAAKDPPASGAGASADPKIVPSGAGHKALPASGETPPTVEEHWPIVVCSAPGGSPAYLAPEVVDLHMGRCRAINATKCDIWALGVILFQCVFGVLPFEDLGLDYLRMEDAYMEDPARRAAMKGDWAAFWQIQAERGLPVVGTSRLDVALRSLVSALLAPNAADRPSSPMLGLHPWIGPAIPADAVAAARNEFRARIKRSKARSSHPPSLPEACTSPAKSRSEQHAGVCVPSAPRCACN